MKKLENPYYQMDQQTQTVILELLKTCRKCNLGNLSFHYFHSPKSPEVTFYLDERVSDWDLTVKHERKRGIAYYTFTDCYRIENETIDYQYSEWDLTD